MTLARQVMRAAGRSLSCGTDLVWSFLIRTPDLIEDRIRDVLQKAFGVDVVAKTGLQLAGSTLTFNPDLRFWGTHGVADTGTVTTWSSLNVGHYRVRQISWAGGDPSPQNAASGFIKAAGEWLNRFA